MAVRYRLTERKANELLHKHGVEHPPVPVEELAVAMGISLRFEPFTGEMSGLLHRTSGGATIGVNSAHASTRQRFTVAHELGHYLLHNDELHVDEGFLFRDARAATATHEQEIEANQFAANLLMPAEFLRREDVNVLDVEHADAVRELAEKYGVSVQAMTLRLSKFLAYGL